MGRLKDMYKFDNGLPFTSPLEEALDSQIERINKNKASMIIIDGGVGEGKTTLAIHCAEYIAKKKIIFKEQLGMGGIDFQEKFAICHERKHIVAIYDEAGDFNTRGALSNFNKSLNRLFEIYRGFKIIVILVLPCVGVLDNSLFDKKIPRFLIYCHGRNKVRGKFSVYSLYRMYYLRDKLKKYISPPFAYRDTNPLFRGYFKNLELKRSEELDKFSTEGKFNIVTEGVLQSKGYYNYKEIGKKLSKSVSWVKQKVLFLKLKPVKMYKRQNYYDMESIYKLEKLLK